MNTKHKKEALTRLSKAEASLIFESLELSTTGFRLLNLLPGGQNDPIVGTLTVHEFASFESVETHYEAVSYSWSKEAESGRESLRSVQCNGSPLPINENAYHALETLRRKTHSRKLWLDEVCINQADKADKAHAIYFFPKIFQSATGVLLFLGLGSELIDNAMEFLPKMIDMLVAAVSEDDVHDRDIPTKKRPAYRTPKMIALNNVLRRPWFDRVWTMQEAVFAAGQMTFICGNNFLPFQVLEKLNDLSQTDDDGRWTNVLSSISSASSANSGNPARGLLFHVHSISELRRMRNKQEMLPMPILLERIRSCGTKFDTDRFLAIRPLCPDYMARLEGPIRRSSFPASDLFYEIAVEELIHHGKLWYLGAAGLWQQRLEMVEKVPSWVADWGFSQRTIPFWVQDHDCFRKTQKRLYNAGSDVPGIASEKRLSKTLIVKGKIVCEIKDLSATFRYMTYQDSSYNYENLDIYRLLQGYNSRIEDLKSQLNILIKLNQETGQEFQEEAKNIKAAWASNDEHFQQEYTRMTQKLQEAQTFQRKAFDDRQLQFDACFKLVEQHCESHPQESSSTNENGVSTHAKFAACQQALIGDFRFTSSYRSTNSVVRGYWNMNGERQRQLDDLFSADKVPATQGNGMAASPSRKMLAELHHEAARARRFFVSDDFIQSYSTAPASTGAMQEVSTCRVGLAPDVAAKGDLICVIPGVFTPLVVRRVKQEMVEREGWKSSLAQNERFKLVGECYVNGLMDGEAMQMEDMHERDIILV